MPDPIDIAWRQVQGQTYEQLRDEAEAKKAKRENLQPLQMGKGQYASIFKVGDRTRPELALSLSDKRSEGLGSGQVELEELVPQAAFKDLEHALAGANVTAMDEAQEGIREKVVYDADEAEVAGWLGERGKRLSISPPVVELNEAEPISGAFAGSGDVES